MPYSITRDTSMIIYAIRQLMTATVRKKRRIGFPSMSVNEK